MLHFSSYLLIQLSRKSGDYEISAFRNMSSEQKNFNMLGNRVVSLEANTRMTGRGGEQKKKKNLCA